MREKTFESGPWLVATGPGMTGCGGGSGGVGGGGGAGGSGRSSRGEKPRRPNSDAAFRVTGGGGEAVVGESLVTVAKVVALSSPVLARVGDDSERGANFALATGMPISLGTSTTTTRT